MRILKRDFGLARCVWKGAVGFHGYVRTAGSKRICSSSFERGSSTNRTRPLQDKHEPTAANLRKQTIVGASCAVDVFKFASVMMAVPCRSRILSSILALFSVMGCSPDTPSTSPVAPTSHQTRDAVPTFGPRLPKHPYDPKLDGPPRPNSTPELNFAGLTTFGMRRIPKLGAAAAATTDLRDASPVIAPSGATDAHRGWWVESGRGIETDALATGYGPDAPYSFTYTWVSIPANWTDALLYAPTTLPHGGSCLEATIIHWHGNHWGSPADHAFGIWDWCNQPSGPFVYIEDMTSAIWKQRYMFGHNFGGFYGTDEQTVVVSIFADNPSGADFSSDCWTALVWNVYAGNWEQKYRSCGVSRITTGSARGWTMHESYHMQGYYASGCTALSSLYADHPYSYIGGAWTPMKDPSQPGGMTTDLLVDGPCWLNGTYGLAHATYPGGADGPGWQALTPTAAFP